MEIIGIIRQENRYRYLSIPCRVLARPVADDLRDGFLSRLWERVAPLQRPFNRARRDSRISCVAEAASAVPPTGMIQPAAVPDFAETAVRSDVRAEPVSTGSRHLGKFPSVRAGMTDSWSEGGAFTDVMNRSIWWNDIGSKESNIASPTHAAAGAGRGNGIRIATLAGTRSENRFQTGGLAPSTGIRTETKRRNPS